MFDLLFSANQRPIIFLHHTPRQRAPHIAGNNAKTVTPACVGAPSASRSKLKIQNSTQRKCRQQQVKPTRQTPNQARYGTKANLVQEENAPESKTVSIALLESVFDSVLLLVVRNTIGYCSAKLGYTWSLGSIPFPPWTGRKGK